jgi:hypothetical protein
VGGIDLGEKFDITGEPNAVRANPGGIFRKGGQGSDTLAWSAVEAGYLRPDATAREFVDLVQRHLRGDKALTFEQQQAASQRAGMEADIQVQVDSLRRRLDLLGVDPEQAQGSVRAMEEYLRQNEPRLLAARLDEAAADARAAELPAREKAPEPPQIAEAKTALQDLQDSGKGLDQFIAEGSLSPAVRNLLIGLSEAGGDAARADRLLADFARTADAQRLRPAEDVAADVVEASRKGGTVTPEPAPDLPATAAGPATDAATADMASSRIAQIQAESPDLVVRVTEDGKPVTLADELAALKREVAEGTPDELGALDAQLVKVAAECALSVSTL